MIQEVIDVLPIERIKFTTEGIKIAIVVPTIDGENNTNKELSDWLLSNSELSENDLQGKNVLSDHRDQFNKIKWIQTYVSIDHFPEVKQQVTQFNDYYKKLAELENDKPINIRRHLSKNLAVFKNLRGAAMIFDYGHT
jgi:hypothetical protein